jgi:hypothetical protein
MVLIACVSNAAIVVFVADSQFIVELFGESSNNYTNVDKVWLFFGMLVVLLLLRWLLSVVIKDVPANVALQMRRQVFFESKLIKKVPDEDDTFEEETKSVTIGDELQSRLVLNSGYYFLLAKHVHHDHTSYMPCRYDKFANDLLFVEATAREIKFDKTVALAKELIAEKEEDEDEAAPQGLASVTLLLEHALHGEDMVDDVGNDSSNDEESNVNGSDHEDNGDDNDDTDNM